MPPYWGMCEYPAFCPANELTIWDKYSRSPPFVQRHILRGSLVCLTNPNLFDLFYSTIWRRCRKDEKKCKFLAKLMLLWPTTRRMCNILLVLLWTQGLVTVSFVQVPKNSVSTYSWTIQSELRKYCTCRIGPFLTSHFVGTSPEVWLMASTSNRAEEAKHNWLNQIPHTAVSQGCGASRLQRRNERRAVNHLFVFLNSNLQARNTSPCKMAHELFTRLRASTRLYQI